MDDLTHAINAFASGTPDARAELLDAIYRELRTMASQKMASERTGHTLQPTALVNEAYVRLFGAAESWENRKHFYAAASEAMRRILVDAARARTTAKRGAGHQPASFDERLHSLPVPDDRVLQIHDALEKLQLADDLKAQIVKLRFFVGLSHQEIADLLDISEKSVRRHWDNAKIWLHHTISQDAE